MCRILLVEDNEMNSDMLQKRLRHRGFEVLLAADGRQGVDMARRERPDLVLMDLSLPEMDGWQATRILKSDAGTCGIPVVALTAHAMVGDRERALEAGCDDYAAKPIDMPLLLKTIARLAASPENRERESPALPAGDPASESPGCA
ncbi:MAG: response regulator [Bryobacteraceae bacterium]|jgi:two-component system, cell cycle response regulator DivK